MDDSVEELYQNYEAFQADFQAYSPLLQAYSAAGNQQYPLDVIIIIYGRTKAGAHDRAAQY
ncbi:MAG: hypothetical protein U5L96_14095 [Owenweeksia sp.]|nr:hypothetical protein [Owenweeksia sp.]